MLFSLPSICYDIHHQSTSLHVCYSTPSTHMQDGLLFLGSRVGNSQVLALPPGTLSGSETGALSAGSGRAGMEGQQAGAPLRWHLTSPALIKSLAPVHDCVVVPDVNGEGPSRLTPDVVHE